MTAPAERQDAGLEVGGEVPANVVLVQTRGPGALVPDLASPAEVQAYIRQKDDEQILAALMGEVLDEWFYEFKVSGKTVEGVSVTGAMEFARIQAERGFPIRFPMDGIRLEETTEHGTAGVRATVIARDHRTGAEGLGMAFYPYMQKRRDGREEFDDKAGRKALSVAKRNAVLDLIPEDQVKSVLRIRKELAQRNEAKRKQEARAAFQANQKGVRQVSGVEYAGEREPEPKALQAGHEAPVQMANAQANPAAIARALEGPDPYGEPAKRSEANERGESATEESATPPAPAPSSDGAQPTPASSASLGGKVPPPGRVQDALVPRAGKEGELPLNEPTRRRRSAIED